MGVVRGIHQLVAVLGELLGSRRDFRYDCISYRCAQSDLERHEQWKVYSMNTSDGFGSAHRTETDHWGIAGVNVARIICAREFCNTRWYV